MLSTLVSLGVIDGATSLKIPYVAGHAARVQGKIYIACGLIESRTLLGQTRLAQGELEQHEPLGCSELL